MATHGTSDPTEGATNSQTNGNSAPSIPKPQPHNYAPGQTLLPPLSRRGSGPGLIVVLPQEGSLKAPENIKIDNGVPSALTKWAEEGYAVVELQAGLDSLQSAIASALVQLRNCTSCEPKDSVGLVTYDPSIWRKLVASVQEFPSIVAVVAYSNVSDDISDIPCPVPCVHHMAGKASQKLPRTPKLTAYDYPSLKSYQFAVPFASEFHYASEAVSHTRNLTFLKRLMDGPYFDLEAIWDEHTYYEFENRSVEHTMATMVEEPYVNHVPTITGGIGRVRLSNFYRQEFIFSNPDDTELELISRTVGIDRVIDEFVFKFTHNKVINWILPGVPPTNKYVQVPFTAVVNIRGDRLYHEHIAWDQASVLKQIGLLPDYLPYPYQIDGKDPQSGKKFEYRLPVAGAESSDKMREKNAVPSNEMFGYHTREVDA